MKTQILMTQLLIFLPIIFSVLIYVLNKKWINYVVFPVQIALITIVLELWSSTIKNGVYYYTLGGWSKAIAIEFCLDHLSLMFISMAVIIWSVILIFVWQQKKCDFKFLFFLMFLEGCFLAFLQVNDLFTFFVLIEIITILSAILILYKKDGISVKAGLYYLLFNSIGMVIYLFGVMLLYLKTGTLNMTLVSEYIHTAGITMSKFSLIHVSFACLFVSMCVKAAIFPVYDWLPRAHTAAPSHVSALLSALLVKTGIYSLIRILNIFDVQEIYSLIFYLGFFTAISGAIFTMSQKDIKAILAFSTISQIGLIMMSLAGNSDIGMMGAYMHIFNHFLFKSLLFLGAGMIINEYGVRRVTEIHGIARAHPLLTVFMGIAIFSITGAPWFMGSLSKGMMKLSAQNDLQAFLFQVINIATLIYFVKFSQIFFGKPPKYRMLSKSQMTGVGTLAVLCVVTYFIQLDMIPTFLSAGEQVASFDLLASINYLEKMKYEGLELLKYLGSVTLAIIIYKVAVKPKWKIWHNIRQFRMKFQNAVVLLLTFLVLVLSYI